MEQPSFRWDYAQYEGRTAHSLVPSRFTLAFLLTFSVILMAIVGATTLAKHFGPPVAFADIFAAEAGIVPGQHIDLATLAELGYSCRIDTLPSPSDLIERCERDGQAAAIHAINALIYDGVVLHLDFVLHHGELSIGDLILLWGTPEVRATGRWVSFNWPKRHITGSIWSEDGQFSYSQFVLYVSFGL